MKIHTVLISGTSQGIGKALAGFLLENTSIQVYGCSRSEAPFDAPNYHHQSIDLSELGAADNWNWPKESEGVALVNNAGLIAPIGITGKLPSKAIEQQMQVNLHTPICLSNRFVDTYSQGVIMNISSGAAHKCLPGWSTYCASKAGLEHYSACLAEELQDSFRVYAVSPGVIDTPMQGEIRNSSNEQFPMVEHFRQLKENDELISPEKAAQHLAEILINNARWASGSLSLRDLY